MRWITSDTEFKEIFLRARTCAYIDSGRTPTALQRIAFDDAEICTHKFGKLLQALMERSSDQVSHCIVLDPDPVHYFHQKFNKYPVLEMTSRDSSADYLSALNEDPSNSPADALGTNWWAFVIVPPSIRWFVHALRSERDDAGHLWIPSNCVELVREAYPHLIQSAH